MKREKMLTGDLGFRRGTAQGGVVGVVTGATGAGGGVNGVQDVEANLRAWTACSIVSSRGREEWLETRRAEVSFGW
jgi:hypothetical protein